MATDMGQRIYLNCQKYLLPIHPSRKKVKELTDKPKNTRLEKDSVQVRKFQETWTTAFQWAVYDAEACKGPVKCIKKFSDNTQGLQSKIAI